MVLHGSGAQKIHFVYDDNARKYEVDKTFEGVLPNLERRWRETDSSWVREELGRYQSETPCEVCGGARLKPEALAVKIAGRNIAELSTLAIRPARDWFASLEGQLSDKQMEIARRILKEINDRLRFLVDVGLEYLNLSRGSGTLSGGESQRIRLASQIGSGLTGVLYVLDEPSIGLHQRDNARLLTSLKGLRDLGNSVLVVEHDEEAILTADHVIDMGPAAGVHGGHVVAEGTPADIMAEPEEPDRPVPDRRARDPDPRASPADLAEARCCSVIGATRQQPEERHRRDPGRHLHLHHRRLRRRQVHLHRSRPSTRPPRRRLNGASDAPAPHERIEGLQFFDKVIDIDQSPIGRTPRSNPATYTGAFTADPRLVRRPAGGQGARLWAGPLLVQRQGRALRGLPGRRPDQDRDALPARRLRHLRRLPGPRYNRETLEVLFRGKSIADVLDMTVDEAADLFKAVPVIRDKMETLKRVGLGYIKVGQQATTLSGGEAQRVKLSKELSRRATGRTLYILDEPTTGLHFEDVRKLLEVLHELVDQGNTVVVIEHNLDVVKTADWILDFGPEGGDGGGEIIAVGTPEDVAANEASWTGPLPEAAARPPDRPHQEAPHPRAATGLKSARTTTGLCVRRPAVRAF